MVAEGRLSRVKLRMSGLGLTLSCSDQTSIHADVQHGVILQLSLDALLVYAHVCAGAKAAANRRKLAVASSIGLSSLPPAQQLRHTLSLFAVQKIWWRWRGVDDCSPLLEPAYPFRTTPRLLGQEAVLVDYLTAWGVAAVTDRLGHQLDSLLPEESVPPDIASNRPPARIVPLAELTAPLSQLASLLLKQTCQPIQAKVVKLLKDAHAAGIGCGRARVLTSRQTIIQRVQACPLALCGSSFCSPALLRDERVINLIITHLKSRGYLSETEDDPSMIYYLA